MRFSILPILVLVALPAASPLFLASDAGQGFAAEEKKRREPIEVPSVEANGIRYEAVVLGAPFGYKQDGGIIAARNATTGQLEWTQRIYSVDPDETIESDKQDVFISAMKLSRDRKGLYITNERGDRFHLNLSCRAARRLSSGKGARNQ